MAISDLFRMKVNPDVFFKFHDGKFVVWNYRAHEQFELTLPYLQRLYAIGTAQSQSPAQPPPAPAQIDAELQDAGLVSASYPTAPWGWDSLPHIFHGGPSGRLAPAPALPGDDSSESSLEYCGTMDPPEPAVIPALDGERFALPAPDVERLKRLSLWDALIA